jgi:hypothetical protein
MMVSPVAMWVARSSMVLPVTAPAGTITQTVRGGASCLMRSLTDVAGLAPSVFNEATASVSMS